MPPLTLLPLPLVAGLGAFLLVFAAEKLHQRRCRVAAHLAGGPTGRPRRWVAGTAIVRASAIAAMAWALVTLYASGGSTHGNGTSERQEGRSRLVFVADLSPSMQLKDAGPGRDKTRAQRTREVVDAILQRVSGDVLFTVIAFYTDALPVIIDAEDSELVRNVFDGLPIWYAMESGKTDLGTGVRKSLAELAEYPPGSSTVFICTDGDTIDLGTLPKPAAAVRDVYVLGVGDPHQGTFIDGHMSRQDASVLSTLAGRLRGQYLDVNEKHVPTLALGGPGRRPATVKTQLHHHRTGDLRAGGCGRGCMPCSRALGVLRQRLEGGPPATAVAGEGRRDDPQDPGPAVDAVSRGGGGVSLQLRRAAPDARQQAYLRLCEIRRLEREKEPD